MSHFIIGWFNTQMFYQLRSSARLEFHPPIWREYKYWDSCLTGLSKWSAVSCCINSSGIKSRECVVSSYIHYFCILNLAFDHDTQTRMKMRELTLRKKQANWMLKEKTKSIRAKAKTKGMEKSRVWKPLATPPTTWSAEKTTVVDDRQIIKAVKMNPNICVCKITNNFQKLGWCSDNLLSYTETLTQNYRRYTARRKPLTSTKTRKARLE